MGKGATAIAAAKTNPRKETYGWPRPSEIRDSFLIRKFDDELVLHPRKACIGV